MTKKKKVIIAVCVLLAVVLAGGGVTAAVLNREKGIPVTLQTVENGSVTASLSATASVESGAKQEYRASTAAKVSAVYVKLGDKVKKGDKLVSFDTADLQKQISDAQKQYNSAASSYQKGVTDADSAKKAAAKLDSQIAALEKRIAQADQQLGSLQKGSAGGASGLPSMDSLPESMRNYMKNLSPEQQQALMQYFAANSGSIRSIQGGGMTGMLDAIVEKSTLEGQLAGLKTQRQLLSLQSGNALSGTQKQLMESLQNTITSLQKQKTELDQGWVASSDGAVTSLGVKAGEYATLLSSGLTVESTSDVKAVVTLGKYDIPKVKVGQTCTIRTVQGDFQGKVTYIAPTVDTGTSSSGSVDIAGAIGDMAGISGLGSISGSSKGLRCEITIQNPDDRVVIGMDVDAEIEIGTVENVPLIPVEALVMEKDGNYCYVYDKEESTVKKVKVEIGINSDTQYEVKSGVKAGEQIVANPSAIDLQDGALVSVAKS